MLWVTGLFTVLIVVQVTAEKTPEQIEHENTTNILSLIIAEKIYFSGDIHGIF